MQLAFVTLLLSCLAATSLAEPEPQFRLAYPNQYPLFRSGFPYSSMIDTSDPSLQSEPRFFYTTLTLTLSTVTSTSVVVASTTCTTSTAALIACVAGRRRRGIEQGLYYDESTNQEDSIFLPNESKIEEPVIEKEQTRTTRQSPAVPIFLQSGYELPDQIRSGRFLLAFATSTVTASSTSTTTIPLTAVCSSTTTYNTCAASG